MAGLTDICVVITTADRTPRPNYLEATLGNLARAGLWQSGRLHSLALVDSGLPGDGVSDMPWPDRALVGHAYLDVAAGWPPEVAWKPAYVARTARRRSAKATAAAALRLGADSGAPWVLLLEDDVDVCADFLGSVGRWLDVHGQRTGIAVHPLCGDNAEIDAGTRQGRDAWDYPVSWFWGLQATVFTAEAAREFADWLVTHPLYLHADGRLDENAHDLELHHWADAYGLETMVAAVPSFVQHIGLDSLVEPGRRWVVSFPSWQGRDWSYRSTTTTEA